MKTFTITFGSFIFSAEINLSKLHLQHANAAMVLAMYSLSINGSAFHLRISRVLTMNMIL